MTTNRRAPVQIKITPCHLSVKLFGRHTIDGWPALIALAIIMIAKIVATLVKFAIVVLVLILPPVTRYVLRHAAGLYLGFRAFYTE